MSDRDFNAGLKMVASSAMVVFLGLILSKVFTYVYKIIIARQFSPEIYGIFSLAVVLEGWVVVLAAMGLGQGLLKYISASKSKKDINYIFWKSIKITLLTSIFGGLILFASADFLSNNFFKEPGLAVFLKLFSFSIPLTVILGLVMASMKAYEMVGWHSFIYNILMTSSKVLFILGLIFIGLEEKSIIYSYLLGTALSLLVASLVLRSKERYIFSEKTQESKKEKKMFLEVLSYSWPLLFAGLAWRVFHWTDSILIGYFMDAFSVGIYNAAVPLAFLISTGSVIFLQMFFPFVNKEYSKGENETVREMGKQVGKWTLTISLPMLTLLLIFPEFFLGVLFGKEYLSAVTALRILAIGMTFMAISDISSQLLAIGGKPRIILYDVLGLALVNLILNIILIPKYGINGAAFATSSSVIIMSLVMFYQSGKIVGVAPFRRKMANVLLSAIFCSIIVIYLKGILLPSFINTILLFCSFTILYILSIFLFKGFDKNDIYTIKNILGKRILGK